MTSAKAQLKQLDERLKNQRRRIDVLHKRPLPGAGARSGFSSQIAAVRHRHTTSQADFFRLVRTPTDAESWGALHQQVEAAVATLDDDLGTLEEQTNPRHRVPATARL